VEADGIGRTEHYAPIHTDQPLPDGQITKLRVTGRNGDVLTGREAV